MHKGQGVGNSLLEDFDKIRRKRAHGSIFASKSPIWPFDSHG